MVATFRYGMLVWPLVMNAAQSDAELSAASARIMRRAGIDDYALGDSKVYLHACIHMQLSFISFFFLFI